jgi:hypothetical protein
MATRTAQIVTLDNGAFRIVLTYDDATMRVSRVDAFNDSPRNRTVILGHPTSGRVFEVVVAAGTTVGRNVPGNRTLRLWDSEEQGGADDWPTIEVR